MKSHKIALLIGLLSTALLLPACTTPPWALEAEKIAQVALPIVEGISTIAGAGPAVAQVSTDINLLITLFQKYQTTPESSTVMQIQAELNTVNADIGQILPAAGVKDSATQSKVTAILQLVSSEFSNIASLIPATGAPAAAVGIRQRAEGSNPGVYSLVAPKTPLPLSSKDFKKKYNEIVKGDLRFRRLK